MGKQANKNVPCHIFLGEWQAVKPACFQFISTHIQGVSEKDVIFFHGDEHSEAQVLEALKTKDLFTSRKVVIYREPDFLISALMDADSNDNSTQMLKKNKIEEEGFKGPKKKRQSGGGELILKWLSSSTNRPEYTGFLIIHCQHPDKRRSLFKKLSKLCQVTNLNIENSRYGKSSGKAQQYIIKWLSQSDKEIESSALKSLLEKVGTDSLSALKNEIDKLINLSGNQKRIYLQDIEGLVVRHREEEIFKITDALRNKNISAAIESLGRILAQNIHPLVVLSSFRNCIYRILAMKIAASHLGFSYEVAAVSYNEFKNHYWENIKKYYPINSTGFLSSMHPYAAYLHFKVLDNFTIVKLFSMLEQMAKMDLALKGSKIPPEIILESFLFEYL